VTIVVDENIPGPTVAALQALGHGVIDVRGTPGQSGSDDALWQRAQGERALLISTDKGFARRRNERHFGILIVRLRQPSLRKIHDRILLALRRFAEREWPGLTVIMRDRVQIVIRKRGRQ
jgi:predicted nuclease of predicted toxin-antitoxin system